MSVYNEVLQVAVKNGAKERLEGQTDQEFITSLLFAIDRASDADFNTLSQEAGSWVEAAMRADNGRQLLPIPEGFEVKSQVTMHGPVVARFQSAVPNQANTPQSNFTPKTKADTAIAKAKKKDGGVVDAIRKTIVLHPDWTTRQVHQYITENGFPQAKLDVVAVNAGDIRKTVAVVKELGFWLEKS